MLKNKRILIGLVLSIVLCGAYLGWQYVSRPTIASIVEITSMNIPDDYRIDRFERIFDGIDPAFVVVLRGVGQGRRFCELNSLRNDNLDSPDLLMRSTVIPKSWKQICSNKRIAPKSQTYVLASENEIAILYVEI